MAYRCKAGSEGPLCGICTEGFYNEGRECKNCNDIKYKVVLLCALLTCAMFLAAAGWWRGSQRLHSMLTQVVDVQRTKIAWQTTQITSAIAWTTDVEWPQPFKYVSQLLANISELSFLPVACVNQNVTFWDELLIATVLPMGMVALAWLVAVLAPPEHAPRKKATSFSLILAFIVLPMAATKIFRTFL